MNHLYFVMKHFHPDRSDVLLDVPVPIPKAQGLTEWFDKWEKSGKSYAVKVMVSFIY